MTENFHPLTALERLRQRTAYADSVDINQFINTLNRQRHIILAVTGLVIALTLLVIFQIKPVYESTAQIMIDARQNHVVDVESVMQGMPADQESIRSEIEILRSRKLAETVINKLNLWQNPEFNAALRPASPVKAIKDFAGNLGNAPVKDPNTLVEIQKQKTIDEFLKDLDVSGVRNSRVITIEFRSEKPETARDVTAMLVESYLTAQLEDKYEATQRASAWLNDRIGELRKKVSDSEAAVEQYRASAGLLQGKDSTLSAEQLSELNTQLILARTQRAEMEAKLRQVQAAGGGDSLAATNEVLQSPLIQKLREQESDLIAKQAEMGQRLGPRHPDMIKAQSELADVKQNIQVEVNRIISGMRNDVEVARSREGALSGNLSQMESRQGQLGAADVKLHALEREADANRTLFETFLNRFKQTSSQEDLQTADARLISAASLPTEPVFPKPKIMIPMSLVIGFALGMMIALLMEYLDRGFRSMEQVEQFTGLSPLGLIPELASIPGAGNALPQNYIVEKPTSVFAEAIRTVRTALLLADNSGVAPKTVLVTSSMPSEGKTSFTLSLARLSAMSGQKIIIIDCDLRRPNVHRGLGLDNKMGMVDILLGTHQIADVLQQDKRTKIHAITTGRSVPNPADLLASDNMRRLLATLKANYDLVVIDSPPALAVADARVLSQMADKTLFLTRWAETPRDVVMMAVKQLANSGANLAGILLTRVNLKKNARYGYADSGYYGRKYSQYYSDGAR
jgi:exopolysaccharide transport family protein